MHQLCYNYKTVKMHVLLNTLNKRVAAHLDPYGNLKEDKPRGAHFDMPRYKHLKIKIFKKSWDCKFFILGF